MTANAPAATSTPVMVEAIAVSVFALYPFRSSMETAVETRIVRMLKSTGE